MLHGIGLTPVYLRETLGAGDQIRGPALICERVATTLVGAAWQADIDQWGNIQLSIAKCD